MKSLIGSLTLLVFSCVPSLRAQTVFNASYSDSGASFQFNQNTGPTNSIVVWGLTNPPISTFSGVPTDTDVNSFKQSATATTPTKDVQGTVWTETNLTGGSKDTINCHATGTYSCFATEIHGVDTLDQISCGTGTGANPVSPTVNTTHSNELLMGFANTSTANFTAAGTGWSPIGIGSQGIEAQQVSAIGSYSASFTAGSSGHYIACIATYYKSKPGFVVQRDSGWWGYGGKLSDACGTAGNAVATITCHTAPTQSGNTLIAWAAYPGNSKATLTDSAGQAWNPRESIDFVGNAGNLTIWELDNTVPGVTNIKISLSPSGPIDSGFLELTGMEVKPYDTGCTGQAFATSAVTATCTLNSTSYDWLFAIGGANGAAGGGTTPSAYTALHDVTTTNYWLESTDEYEQTVAAGKQTPSITWPGTASAGIAAIALNTVCGGGMDGAAQYDLLQAFAAFVPGGNLGQEFLTALSDVFQSFGAIASGQAACNANPGAYYGYQGNQGYSGYGGNNDQDNDEYDRW